jgi:hypothetical protein
MITIHHLGVSSYVKRIEARPAYIKAMAIAGPKAAAGDR